MIQWLNIAVFLAALYGGFLAIGEGRKHQRLVSEHRALANEVGSLEITDENKVHIVALDSEDPLHFRWRIYYPAHYTAVWRIRGVQRYSGHWRMPEHFIAQVRFRKNDNGRIAVFTDANISRGVTSLGDEDLQEFLVDRWDELEWTQAGAEGPVAIDRREAVTLLRGRMSDALAKESKAAIPSSRAHQLIPVLYDVRIGPKDAVEGSGSH